MSLKNNAILFTFSYYYYFLIFDLSFIWEVNFHTFQLSSFSLTHNFEIIGFVGKSHIRHWLLPAVQHRDIKGCQQTRAADNRGIQAGPEKTDDLRSGRLGGHSGSGPQLAKGQPGDIAELFGFGRNSWAGRLGGWRRRRVFCSGFQRTLCTLLATGRKRVGLTVACFAF